MLESTSSYNHVLGGYNHQFGLNSGNYNVVVGGANHQFGLNSGHYNVVVGGANHQFIDDDSEPVKGGNVSAIVGGDSNIIRNGGWRSAMLGGNENEIRNAHDAVIIGGFQNKVGGGVWTWARSYSAIIGGSANIISAVPKSVILGGTANQITAGTNNVILGAENATAAGTNLSVFGHHTKGTGDNQVVIGRYNEENDANTTGGKVFIIGNGNSSARSNAMSVDWNGRVQAGSMVLTDPSTSDISMGPFTAQP